MAARTKPTNAKDSTANLGFEAKLWLAADGRNAVETTEGNRSNTLDALEYSRTRQTTNGSPQGEHGDANQFYTPSCVVRLLVEMPAPYKARICDPACESGGRAKCEVRSASVEAKTQPPFAIRKSPFDISPGPENAGTFRRELHPDLSAGWQMANAEVRMWN
jgi:hypothetical protein